MGYLLDLGPIEQNLARQAYRNGQPLPDRIANAPELFTGLELYLEAFFELDTERSHGMGITMIPWSSIKFYCQAYKLSSEQAEDLVYFIRSMDIAHTKRLSDKAKSNGHAS